MSRLLATERCTYALHFFEHILVADVCAQHLNAGAFERQLQPHIRHGCSHHGGFREHPTRLHVTRREQQNRVPVDDSSARITTQSPVSIAIKGNAQIEMFGFALVRLFRDEVRDRFRMQRPAIFVDVLSIGRGIQKRRFDLSRVKQLGGFGGRGAVGTIDRDAKPAQVG